MAAGGLRQITPRERLLINEFSARHGSVRSFAQPISDDRGDISSPLIRLPLLARLEARGTISSAEAEAGERFGWLFRLAQLDSLKAADMARPASVAGYRDAAVSTSGEHARRQVSNAMRALGGAGSIAASAAWHIAGLEWNVSRWALVARRPREQCCGILIGALSALSAHFASGRPARRA